jgi:hypothetical protein
VKRSTARHAGSTTGPIDSRALRARLQAERRGEPIPVLAVPAPTVTYTAQGRRHLWAVMLLAVVAFLLTVAVSTWVELRGPDHGYARWMREPVPSRQTTQAPPVSLP